MTSPIPSTPTPKSVNGHSTRLYQNTYRLRPKKKFNVMNVKEKVKLTVDLNLQDVELSEASHPDLCISLAEEIKNTIKEEKYDRFTSNY